MKVLPPIVALAVLAVAAGCGESEETGGPVTDFAEEFSVAGALAEVPRPEVSTEGEGIWVAGVTTLVVADYASAASAAGIERPDEFGDWPEDWAVLLLGQAGSRAGLPRSLFASDGFRYTDEFEAELGFSIVDVDRVVEVVGVGSQYVAAVTRTDLSPAEAVAGADGVFVVGAGPDADDVDDRTAPQPVSLSFLVAAPDADRGMVAAANVRAPVDAWRVGGGADGSWADDEDLRLVAARLDDRDVYAAQVNRGDFSIAGLGAPADRDDPDPAAYPIEIPFSALGVGWVGTGIDARVLFVYVFADDATAESALEQVGAAYEASSPDGVVLMSDMVSDVVVAVDGRTVVVEAVPAPPFGGPTAGDVVRFGWPLAFHR